jgi:dienelactone hydrolase
MMESAKAHYDCIKVFSETDFTEDLKAIAVPTLVMHDDDDQIVPYADSALLSAKLLRNGLLKTFAGLPHGMCTTHPDFPLSPTRPLMKAPQSVPQCARDKERDTSRTTFKVPRVSECRQTGRRR